jgi:carbon monoxide dehydrogenase subunit G
MDFSFEAVLPTTPDRIWTLMIDIERMAACIPGCEKIEEQEKLKLYSAVMKQKIGPFKLEVPAQINVESYEEPSFVNAAAAGKDKFTGTTLTVSLKVNVAREGYGASKFSVNAQLAVAGRLASLGYSVIKKKAEENFIEFERRIKEQLAQV